MALSSINEMDIQSTVSINSTYNCMDLYTYQP